LASRDFEEAERHRFVMESHLGRLQLQVIEIERQQDILLDRMSARG
jgi:hypothetical protein